MMPPVIPPAASFTGDDGSREGRRKALSAAAISSFHLQDLETERLQSGDSTTYAHDKDDSSNNNSSQPLCPLIPPKLGWFILRILFACNLFS